MDNIDKIIKEFFPERDITPFQRRYIRWLFNEKGTVDFYQSISDKHGVEWIDALIEKLNFRVEVHNADYDNIPASGPAIVIANHPTVLDGLSLISTVARVRKDIKIVANHLLQVIFPSIESITIGIKNMQGEFSRQTFKEINSHLKKGGVLVMCPAGRLASTSLSGLKEAKWQAGFIQFAARTQAAIVPVHITGRNSLLYYMAANIWRPLSNMMVLREGLRHKGRRVRMKICHQLDVPALLKGDKPDYEKISEDIRRHLLLTKKSNASQGVLPVLRPVALPEDRMALIKALYQCKALKTLKDGKVLYLYRYQGEGASPILNELGRLREITYRAIGAGTGGRRDNDIYDREYYHIILWEPHDLEIVGAYRVLPACQQIEKRGIEGLYSHSLFKYAQSFTPKVRESIEVGRGFIQNRYQRTNALDVLWKGIFSFVADYPECKYLLGVLTIPQSFTHEARDLIVGFFQRYFSDDTVDCHPLKKYVISDASVMRCFCGDNFEEDRKTLSNKLRELGYELPWPYKQAAKWYQPSGSKLFCFIEDNHFNSIAGLNFCEIASLKNVYFTRYITRRDAETVN
ncbi:MULTISPECIES: lysophospholipid acyltransferase family protein [Tenebrionibacter/Tenebrionicola group]|jgi:putative hemolysin|uniref:L-ornithine N(alpha)-acyltransferase n=2 Tax=Tenebrionibacter/Tenebrionicola group TaxID=2969848 RepID=A0A8K0V2F9_9ENTR|nr:MULTISPECIES: lysophospholipid acyltransferase family protein [Tenebrionibacter/Tenebrionicola group]MBK4714321.1 lysophospholipid acyltransferase family protein [Tenebrionibacter intestinalis]MBV5095272.1 lysophospholipid acyltransferase family protein [Tenebrionicola larvae]